MTTQEILRAARALPPHEQQFLPLNGRGNPAWGIACTSGRFIRQEITPRIQFAGFAQLPARLQFAGFAQLPDWPRDESAGDFVSFMRGQRRQPSDLSGMGSEAVGVAPAN